MLKESIFPPLAAAQPEAAELSELILEIGAATRRSLRADLVQYNLTPPQFAAMHCIWKSSNAMKISDLAEAAGQVHPTMTGIVNRLEERGLLARRQNPDDRRNQLVSMTPEGEKVVLALCERRRKRIQSFLAPLQPAERSELFRLLQQFLSVITHSL
ncbi:MAG: MarR family transcriptional regulator [Anaerolineaceae bacterium]|nr:MarR family transcriptional regulator [Anaerolineaceae bacterium]